MIYKILFIASFYIFLNPSVSAQEFIRFHTNTHFTFYKEDSLNYTAYVNEFNESYNLICQKLDLPQNHKIIVKIFKNQKSFIEEIFGYYEKKVTSVGMTKPDQNMIYLTSFYDTTTGRDFSEYLKVIRHELVHVLFFNEHKWLSEGLALYIADQKREIEKLPKNPNEILIYIEKNIINKEAYGYYYFLTQMIIKKAGFISYLEFYQSDMDWDMIGYKDAQEFCNDAFKEIISLHNNVYKK